MTSTLFALIVLLNAVGTYGQTYVLNQAGKACTLGLDIETLTECEAAAATIAELKNRLTRNGQVFKRDEGGANNDFSPSGCYVREMKNLNFNQNKANKNKDLRGDRGNLRRPLCKGPPGVFLRIDNLKKGARDANPVLNLNEVTAYDKDGKAIAPLTTAMSSQYSAELSVGQCHDGKTGSTEGGKGSCHSNGGDKNPWLVFGYRADAAISKIVVYNRADCCANRIVGATIRVCSDSGCTKNVLFTGKFDGTKTQYTWATDGTRTTLAPTKAPTKAPAPTQAPTKAPAPTQAPTKAPAPTQAPTQAPITTPAGPTKPTTPTTTFAGITARFRTGVVDASSPTVTSVIEVVTVTSILVAMIVEF